MKTIDFVLDVIGSTLRGSHFVESFLPSRLKLWLEKHRWVEDPNSPCVHCEHLFWFSEEKCRENVKKGGTCYRETLRLIFIPFIKDLLNNQAPSIRELGKIIHKKGPIHDGISDNFKLIDMIDHELGGIATCEIKPKEMTEADHEYIKEIRKFFEERKTGGK